MIYRGSRFLIIEKNASLWCGHLFMCMKGLSFSSKSRVKILGSRQLILGFIWNPFYLQITLKSKIYGVYSVHLLKTAEQKLAACFWGYKSSNVIYNLMSWANPTLEVIIWGIIRTPSTAIQAISSHVVSLITIIAVALPGPFRTFGDSIQAHSTCTKIKTKIRKI